MGKALLFLLFSLTAFAADDLPYPIRQVLRHDYQPAGNSIPVALLDADQTIRMSTTRWRAPRRPGEVLILPEVREKIRALNDQGFLVAVISNQESPVHDTGRELIERTMAETVRKLETEGAKVNYVDFSVSEEEAKPAIVMFQRLEANLKSVFGANTRIDLEKSFMVGDAAYLAPVAGFPGEKRPNGRPGLDTSNFDRRFAENCGVKFYEPQEFFGWEKYGVERFTKSVQVPQYLKAKADRHCPVIYNVLNAAQ